MVTTRRSEALLSVSPRPRQQQRDGGVKVEHGLGNAVRFSAAVAVAGLGFLILAALWVSTCTESMDVDTMACGVPQRTFLGLGAPLILLAGAIWAFVRTYRAWRAGGGDEFWTWQGAGWFLSTVMLVTLAMGFPALAGPAFGG